MGLNTEQLQAVNSNSDRILCLAGAGSGKTFSLVERITRMVNDGVFPGSILVLTFTNAAAAEMKSRYETKNVGKVVPEFRTFHAFCYSIMCKDAAIRNALGYTTPPDIASDAQEKSIQEQAKAQCKITISKEKLSDRENLTRDEQRQVELYDKAVNRLMLMNGIITFDALNEKVSDLFVKEHPATKPYKLQYTHILVDETQDTNGVQMRFLNSFSNSTFYFCGDVLQNLYSWRGTSNEFMKALANTPGWEVIKLFTNYRSTNQICEFANKFSATYADPSYRIEMQGTRDGEKVHKRFTESPAGFSLINSKSLDDVAATYAKLDGTSAILCRTNKEVAAVASYLTKHEIEFTTTHESKLTFYISCALSETYTLECMASYLSSDKYGEYIRLAAQTKRPDLAWFLKLYGKTPRIKDDIQAIEDLTNISVLPGTTSEKLKEVSKRFNINIPVTPDKDYFGDAFLKYLQDITSTAKSSELYVGTIHSVKGLEYDNVFVMNVGSYNFKLNNEDMKNLFYVAITRAKNRLYVYELFD